MPKQTIFLFGEAEKGEFCTPVHCRSLDQLMDNLGNAPQESLGISYAVQTLLYERELIFFRVKEEGFSTSDYMKGVQFLQKEERRLLISAICLPGVGDAQIIEAMSDVCLSQQAILILAEKDFFDYLTYEIRS